MKHLYFVRHGESVRNVERTYAGQFDTPLTDRGRDQARAAGEQARGLRFDLMVSSPLSRALETARIIARATGYPADKILVNDIFKERAFGTMEGKSWHEIPEEMAPSYGGESEEQVLVRAKQSLDFLRSLKTDTILLVGHGTFFRMLRTALDPSKAYEEPENARIVQLL